MTAACSPALALAPNNRALSILLKNSRLPDLDGTVSLEPDGPQRLRLVFEGGESARRVWLYGVPFDAGLLFDMARQTELARLTNAFVKEAADALRAKPLMPFRPVDC